MSLLQSILLGVLQGVTEFLPVSSSGHLAIAEHLFGFRSAADVPPFFDVLLHLGTILAVCVAYRIQLRAILAEFFRGVGDLARGTMPRRVPPERRMALLLLAGTLPLALVLPIKDKVEALSDNLNFVGAALLFTGCMLWLGDSARRGHKSEKTARVSDALLVGLAQAVAVCPGVSRSGLTISAGCVAGFDRRFAVRYSFLLSVPAVLGANLLALIDALRAGVAWREVPVYLAGVLTAAVVGYVCLRLLRYIARSGHFAVFAFYCWAVGILVLVFTLVT